MLEGNKSTKKDDNIIYIKNMFKNKFFDYIYYTKHNINNNLKNVNKVNSKNKGIKNVNINFKNKNNG